MHGRLILMVEVILRMCEVLMEYLAVVKMKETAQQFNENQHAIQVFLYIQSNEYYLKPV